MHRWIRVASLILFLASAAGCGKSGSKSPTAPGGGGGGGGGGGSSPMSAMIDGVAWTADPLAGGHGVTLTSPGQYLIQGIRAGSGSYLILSLYNIGGPGTYPLGVSGTCFGGSGIVGDLSHSWNTPTTGSAGSVTITTLTATRIAGTFAFQAAPFTGGATGTRTVTAGTFDFPVTGNPGPLPANAGSRLQFVVDGVPWNGATVSYGASGTGATRSTVLGAFSDDRVVSIALTGLLPPGDYPLNSIGPITMMITSTNSPNLSWGGSVSVGGGGLVTDDTGTITILSHTATRLSGTFAVTLAPSAVNGGPSPTVITSGEFDIGLP